MGCPNTGTLGQNLTFTIQAYNASGSAVDTDALPTYSIYEDETTTAIVTGTMAKLDDAGTTGFYSEQVAVSVANGFELFKSYSIRCEAAVATLAIVKTFNFIVTGSAIGVSATTGALTTLANFKAYAGISGTDDDTLITALIARATSAIQAYCDRLLISDEFRERHDGDGSYELFTEQWPITDINILSVRTSDVISVTNTNSDAQSAFVTVDDTDELSTSLICTVQGGTNDGSDTLTFAARGTYTVTTLVTAIGALGKGWAASVLLTEYQNWDAVELLPMYGLQCLDSYVYLPVPDEGEGQFYISQVNGGRSIYRAFGFSKGHHNVTVRYTGGYVTIPADLEQICIDLVNTYYRSRSRDASIKSERLGDHWITFVDGGGGGARDIPAHIAKRLAPYRRWR